MHALQSVGALAPAAMVIVAVQATCRRGKHGHMQFGRAHVARVDANFAGKNYHIRHVGIVLALVKQDGGAVGIISAMILITSLVLPQPRVVYVARATAWRRHRTRPRWSVNPRRALAKRARYRQAISKPRRSSERRGPCRADTDLIIRYQHLGNQSPLLGARR